MKNRIFLSALFMMVALLSPAQTQQNYQHYDYTLSYGIVKGGVASITTTTSSHDGRDISHTKIVGRTRGLIDKLYKVYDIFESTYDANNYMPLQSIRDVHEGKHLQYESADFIRSRNVVNSNLIGETTVEPDVRDLVSGLLMLCNLDYSQCNVGQVMSYNVYHEKKAFPIQVKYKGIETIKVNKKKYRCYCVAPMVDPGDLFKEKEGLNMWIAADDTRRIIFAKLNFSVGSFKLTIDE